MMFLSLSRSKSLYLKSLSLGGMRFQEKFGMAADVYGEQGMEQVKAPASGFRHQMAPVSETMMTMETSKGYQERNSTELARNESKQTISDQRREKEEARGQP